MKLIDSSTGEGDRLDEAAFQFRIPMSLGEAHDELDNCNKTLIDFSIKQIPQIYNKSINSFVL